MVENYMMMITWLAKCRGSMINGEDQGLWSLGATTYTVSVFIVTCKIMTRMHTFTWIHHVTIWGISLFLWLACLYLLSYFYKWTGFFADLSGVGGAVLHDWSFFLLLLLSPVVAILPGAALELFRNLHDPVDSEIMKEMELGWSYGVFSPGSQHFVERIPPTGRRSQKVAGGVVSQMEKAASRQAILVEDDEGSRSVSVLQNEKSEMNEVNIPGIGPPRRLTWREVVNDDQLEDLNISESLGRYGRRRSSGFQVVTRHSDEAEVPIPIEDGPTPPHRRSVSKVMEQVASAAGASNPRAIAYSRVSSPWIPQTHINIEEHPYGVGNSRASKHVRKSKTAHVPRASTHSRHTSHPRPSYPSHLP